MRATGLLFILAVAAVAQEVTAESLQERANALRPAVEKALGEKIPGEVVVAPIERAELLKILCAESERIYSSMQGGPRGEELKRACESESKMVSTFLLAKVTLAEAMRRYAGFAVHTTAWQKDLVAALADEVYGVRRPAAHALASSPEVTSEAIPALTHLLEEENLCDSAAKALGRMGQRAREAVVPLRALLTRTPDSENRCAAALALIRIGEEGAPLMQVFRDGLQDETRSTRVAVIRMIRDLEHQGAPLVPDLMKALAREDLVLHAIRVLADLGPAASEAIPSLEKLLGNGELKFAAEEAIRKIRG